MDVLITVALVGLLMVSPPLFAAVIVAALCCLLWKLRKQRK